MRSKRRRWASPQNHAQDSGICGDSRISRSRKIRDKRNMLTLFRRHLDVCPHKRQGRNYTKCSCPIHCDGVINGQRIRASLDTSSWDRARRRLGEIEEEALNPRPRKSVADAAEAFSAALE